MRPSRVLVAVSAALVLGLSGCTDDEPDDASAPSPTSSAPTSTAPTTSTPPAPEPTSDTPVPAPSPTASENAQLDACASVTAQQMSDVLFVPVEQALTEDGCRYAVPDDAAAPAVDFVQTSGFTAADLTQARLAAEVRTGRRPQPIEDVGDEAFFAVEPDDNTGQLTGSGGVLVGDTFVEVILTQDMDQIEPEVGQAVIDAVGLAGDALGG